MSVVPKIKNNTKWHQTEDSVNWNDQEQNFRMYKNDISTKCPKVELI